MNKQQLIKKISSSTNIPIGKAKALLNALLQVIIESLQNDKKVSLKGLGTFSVKKVIGRYGLNPKTGEVLIIPDIRSLEFRFEKSFKDSLNSDLHSIVKNIGDTNFKNAMENNTNG